MLRVPLPDDSLNVERFFGWLESYRKIAVRYERTPKVFLALVRLACILILWRVMKWVQSERSLYSIRVNSNFVELGEISALNLNVSPIFETSDLGPGHISSRLARCLSSYGTGES